jgi:hypothetical protein
LPPYFSTLIAVPFSLKAIVMKTLG